MQELIVMQDDESQSLKGSPGNKGKVQRAAKMLQTAFVEFYRGLRLLRNLSSLNMMAFVRIRKKYDKVTGVWQLPQDGRKLSLCNVGQGSKVYGPRRESVHSALYERQPKASHGISQAHTLCEQSWKYKLYPGDCKRKALTIPLGITVIYSFNFQLELSEITDLILSSCCALWKVW
ncbi:uncharacterized protein LOC9647032 isoform X1 [Selaginella moellendorffii]|uniref:uncharacterized protein LOC9647032 isoform X1 n=1 Tax=Selaginella moellendorffii TaxID=88036 RepID=UPI000D1CED6B|nr:uncharacterized protein LOC9647032 isoform X1 [Selaginella moellendorffii]|eukprot:XP_024540661.1 uncharacterized protein LOC9647032 isoform X1 [Selaginella moellendorffii]